jgi:aspartokinase
MNKVTDLLLDTMRHAEAGDRTGMAANLKVLRTRHDEACRDLLPEVAQAGVLVKLHEVVDEFERIVNGMAMLGERPPRSVDEAVAVGERLSGVLLSEYLKSEGTPSVGVNARDWCDRCGVRQRIAADGADAGEGSRNVEPLLEQGYLPVITVQRRHRRRAPDYAGRGGSIFGVDSGAALDAAELWI